MTIRTQLKAGRRAAWGDNHNEALQTRTGLKAGARKVGKAGLMVVRTDLKAGRRIK